MASAAAKLAGAIKLPTKLLGLNDPERATASELSLALDRVRSDRAGAIAKIAELTATRTSALLGDDNDAVSAIERDLDFEHRRVERSDILLGEIEQRLIAAQERERVEADRQLRQATSAKLLELSDQLATNGAKLGSALRKFGAAIAVLEAIGDATPGIGGIVNQAIAAVDTTPQLSEMLRARSAKVLSGSGPATFAGLDM